jgi:protein involved in polysaccharide export with SLBB domain
MLREPRQNVPPTHEKLMERVSNLWSPLAWRRWPWLALCLLAGCALGQPYVDQALMADKGGNLRNEGVAECYVVHPPDVLEVTVTCHPELSGKGMVGTDGRIALKNRGLLRVEGQTVPESERRLALALGLPVSQVHLQVAEYKSQQIYLFGQGIGLQRAVSYQGPETVLDLLQRTGGIMRGAEPRDVYVVRSHVANGASPQLVHINLPAILESQDQQSNLRLEPFDQVFIGETGPSSFEKCVPPCVRPIYQVFWGLAQDKEKRQGR